jgi:segregation and condensation protein A
MNQDKSTTDMTSGEQGASTPEPHKFKLDQFEGPLDLLLFLIKKNDVNIYDIPIAEITEQYIQFIELATHISLEDLTDFYHLASTLIYIKSKMLLPIELDLDEELEDPRKELVAKLIEYQKFKKLTALMAEKKRPRNLVYGPEEKRTCPTLC